MKFRLSKASDWNNINGEIEINTLDELIDFINTTDENLVIGKDIINEGNYRIVIYDDNLE